METFNLELAKAKHPVQTRDGRPARIICYDKKGTEYPIVALIYNNERECEIIEEYSIDGKASIHLIDNRDLVMAPVTKEGWVNVYKDKEKIITGNVYTTEEEAIERSSDLKEEPIVYIATTKIEWEE